MTAGSTSRQEQHAAHALSNLMRDCILTLRKYGRRIEAAWPAGDDAVVCRKCHWKCLQPSRRKSRLDLFLACFLLHPFRCRSCGRRYYRLAL